MGTRVPHMQIQMLQDHPSAIVCRNQNLLKRLDVVHYNYNTTQLSLSRVQCDHLSDAVLLLEWVGHDQTRVFYLSEV